MTHSTEAVTESKSRLMRVSSASHERIAARAADQGRTLIAEHDRIVDAGLASLEASEKRSRARRKAV